MSVCALSHADVPVRRYSQPTASPKSSAFLFLFLSKKPQAIMCVHQQVLKAFDRNNRANPQRQHRSPESTMWLESEDNHPKRSKRRRRLPSNVLRIHSPRPSSLMGQVCFLSLMSCNSLEEDSWRGAGILNMADSCASPLAPEHLQAA